eukprot:CAMPEP_0183336864 /NCGR_PEP_ID=MMETSP0164_2-20130417/4718_1 /TAXON_ID=221442 /ORGANISM="Coccolithus pelagicus ssp braarudi, Strain PLY182g" /LENGTH=144 /DNA_ID=CAMNT_0025506473 /DNA_START=546 /DNA_END=979 /DNA_ORIENTATION=+
MIVSRKRSTSAATSGSLASNGLVHVDDCALAATQRSKFVERDPFLLDHIHRLAARARKCALVKPPPATLPGGIRIDPQRIEHHRKTRRTADEWLRLRHELFGEREVGLSIPAHHRFQETFPPLSATESDELRWQLTLIKRTPVH